MYSLLVYTLHHRVVEYDIVQSLQLFLQTNKLARHVADARYQAKNENSFCPVPSGTAIEIEWCRSGSPGQKIYCQWKAAQDYGDDDYKEKYHDLHGLGNTLANISPRNL